MNPMKRRVSQGRALKDEANWVVGPDWARSKVFVDWMGSPAIGC